MMQQSMLTFLVPLFLISSTCTGFLQPPSVGLQQQLQHTTVSSAPPLFGVGVGKTVEKNVLTASSKPLSIRKVKEELLDLLPRMTGTADEFSTVEKLVNTLEELYQPTQTLDFLNLALEGSWQLLFSTNLAGTPNPSKFRLRELIQSIACDSRQGTCRTSATWDLAQAGDGRFDATGTFTAQCTYDIQQGSRMILELQDHVLEPSRGSAIPTDVPALVGLLHRSMPKELFDPSNHSVDTTYLDGNVRIVRYTGPQYEGVRDIFIRQGALAISPE